MMPTLALIASSFFAVWFWQKPAPSRAEPRWPAALPVFAGGRVETAYELKNGTSFASFTSPQAAPDILAAARAAYAEAGWVEIPFSCADTALFVRGESVATILAEATPSGARVTILQRPKGL